MSVQESKNGQSGSSKDKATPPTPTTPKAGTGVVEASLAVFRGSDSSSSV